MPDTSIDTSSSGSGGLAPGLTSGAVDTSLPALEGGKQTEQQIVDSMSQQASQEQQTGDKQPGTQEPVVDQQQTQETDEEKAARAAQEETDDLTVTEEDLSVAKIQQFAKELPELKAAFDKNPQVRNAIFAMARRSAKLGEIQAVIPTVEAAKFAAENSESFMALNDLFFAEDQESTTQFWSQLYENALLRDPQTGQVVVDKRTNAPISTGAYERVTSAYRNALYSDLTARVNGISDAAEKQKWLDAITLVQELAGDKQRSVQQSQQGQLTPEQQAKLDKADRLEQQLNDQRQERSQEFQSSIARDIVSTVKGDISTAVDRLVKVQNVALTAYEQKKVVDDIFSEIDQLANDNRQYQLHFDGLLRRAPQTEQGRKSLVAEARKFAKEILPSVVQKVIREATSTTVDKNNTQTAKRVTQASHREVKTSGGAPRPASQDTRSKAKARAAELKRPLTEDEILAL